MLESQKGTLHTLNFVLVMGVVSSSIYVLVVLPVWGIMGGDWCMGGLGSLMYALMTIEANEKAGVFKTRRYLSDGARFLIIS